MIIKTPKVRAKTLLCNNMIVFRASTSITIITKSVAIPTRFSAENSQQGAIFDTRQFNHN